MMLVVPFEEWHLAEIELRGMDMILSGHVNDRRTANALAAHPSHTGFNQGEPIAAAGVVPAGPGRHVVWAILGDKACGHLMIPIHRATLAWLETAQKSPTFKRIETTVRCDFPLGLRWAKMLGFRRVSLRLRDYDVGGNDHYLFERLAHG